MATSPVPSMTPPAPPLDSSTPIAPPPVAQPNETSDTQPPSSPSTLAMSSAPPLQSPPPPILSSPPPSSVLTPPPTSTPPPPDPSSPPPSLLSSPPPAPPASPPPSPPAAPPPAATSSPPVLLPPPPPSGAASPPPLPSPVVASPPSPSLETPSPPHPVDSHSPPPPREESPPGTPTANPPPPPRNESPTTTPSPPAPVSPTTSPSPPSATSSPPPSKPSSSSPAPVSPPVHPTNSSASGSLSPPVSLPTEKPTARSTTHGTSNTLSAMSPKGGSGGGGMKPGSAAAIGLVVGFLALSLVVMAVWFVRRRKRRNGSGYGGGYVMPSPFASSPNSDSTFLKPQSSPRLTESGSASSFMYSSDPNSKSWFTYEELFNATQGFSDQKLLGEGGFGCVYKGLLVDGREVAVKQLKIGGGQGEREFRAEVEIISRVHHRHLVSLVGYCISDHQRLLVYEYVANNTLHYHLHRESRPVMEWSTRVKVAVGAARGIAYLHEDCHPRIIHRDIKSSNILLDNNFDARVADFGLAKLAADANTHVSTRVMGTFGYLAPEYASSGKLTEKSDVFSYGVVLLELITGRKSVDGSQPLGDESLVEWARPLLNEALENEKFEDLIDPRLENNFVEIEMFRMIEAAAACIRHLAPKRPRMSQVVRAFDSMEEYSDLTNGMKLGESKIHDSREQSAQIRMFQRMAFGSQEYSSEYFDRSNSSWKS